jgi:adenylate cyclase
MLSYETYAQVRDIVDAEKGAPIAVKGISREVVPYAVKGLSDGDASRFIKKERDGMRLFLDIGKLDKRQRRATAKELKDIIARLEN